MKTVGFHKSIVAFFMTLIMVLCYTSTVTAAINEDSAEIETQIVSNGTETSVGLGGTTYLKLLKSVAETGVENEFLITLTVETMSQQETSSPDLAVVLVLDVSNSMAWDIDGDETKNYYETRMKLAVDAAKAFVENYAAGANGAKRMISIVTFGSHAVTKRSWIDVADAQNKATVLSDIESTITKNKNNDKFTLNNDEEDGATNVEGGLMLAKNLMNMTTISSLKITDNNKYTILLTDGAPTYHVADSKNDKPSTTKIQGAGSGSKTSYKEDVVPAVTAATELKKVSNLYTIAFASADEECFYTKGTYHLVCELDGHTHGDSCAYTYVDEEHTHDESCNGYTIDCGIEEHEHALGCLFGLFCSKTAHTHSESCLTYGCGKTGHTHTESCRTYSCGKTEHTHTGQSGSCYSETVSIGAWLRSIASIGGAYNAADLTGLNDAFANIGTTIEHNAQAGTVTDPMSDAVDFVSFIGTDGKEITAKAAGATLNEEGTQFVWSLGDITPTEETVDGVKWYTYTLSYKVRLDTTSEAYQNAENNTVPTNGTTTLSYTIKNGETTTTGSTNFNVPTVTGYDAASIHFTKVGPSGSALSGARFGLTVKGDSSPLLTATATEDGVVEFKNVPSGQVYILKEIEAPTGYALNDTEYEVTVSMGNWSAKLNGEEISVDDLAGFTVVNEYSYVTVTLSKTVINANGSDISELHGDKKFFVKISGKTFDGNEYVTWVVVSSKSTEAVMLPQGTYTLTELELTDYEFVKYQVANTTTEVNPAADIIVIDSEVTGTVEVEIVNKYEDDGYFHKTGDVENVIPGGAM